MAPDESMNPLSYQLVTLFVLALPVACIAWTITHEELFREFHDRCEACSQSSRSLVARKFFFIFTCEFCFSHYVTFLVLMVTGYRLIWPDWRGFLVAGFSMVWIANIYMSAYARLRLDIKHERVDIAADERALEASTERPRPREVSQRGRR
jgi:hypothetical protein